MHVLYVPGADRENGGITVGKGRVSTKTGVVLQGSWKDKEADKGEMNRKKVCKFFNNASGAYKLHSVAILYNFHSREKTGVAHNINYGSVQLGYVVHRYRRN